MNIAVEQYTPSPLRCFKCQKYGHHQTACRHEKVCAKCGLADHDPDPCSRAPYCINCKGDYPAYYTTCPAWISAKEKEARLPSTAPRAESQVRLNSVSHCSSPSHASATSKFLVIEPNDKEKTLTKLTPFEIEGNLFQYGPSCKCEETEGLKNLGLFLLRSAANSRPQIFSNWTHLHLVPSLSYNP